MAPENPNKDRDVNQELDCLWKLLSVAREEHQFLTEQRAKLTHVMLLLATAALALLKLGSPSNNQVVIISFFLVFVGVIGALLTFEVSKACGESAYCEALFLNQIAEREPNLNIRRKDEVKPGGFRWMGVHITISVFGVSVLLFRLLSPLTN